MDRSFSWATPLGASVALFLAYGVIHVLSGAIYVLVAQNRQQDPLRLAGP